MFWRQGYQATSVQDLVEATGLNRGSLYDTFGDKHGLFLEAVEHYRRQYSARRLAQLEEEGPLRDKLAAFFNEMIEFSVESFLSGGSSALLWKGCLQVCAFHHGRNVPLNVPVLERALVMPAHKMNVRNLG